MQNRLPGESWCCENAQGTASLLLLRGLGASASGLRRRGRGAGGRAAVRALGWAPVSSARPPHKAAPGRTRGLCLWGPTGRNGWVRMLGRGQWGHEAHTSFFRKPELVSIPLRTGPPAWKHRYSRTSKPFVWERDFFRVMWTANSSVTAAVPSPAQDLAPSSCSSGKRAGHPGNTTHEQLCTQNTLRILLFAVLNAELKRRLLNESIN